MKPRLNNKGRGAIFKGTLELLRCG